MEFNKNNVKVPKPFWMFCLELSNLTGRNIHVIKTLKLVTELWSDRLVNGTYKVVVKDLKVELKTLKDSENDDINAYYDLGITLKQLMHDEIINDGIKQIEDIFNEHFIQE